MNENVLLKVAGTCLGVLLLLSGCTGKSEKKDKQEANKETYEDKDMTNAFMQKYESNFVFVTSFRVSPFEHNNRLIFRNGEKESMTEKHFERCGIGGYSIAFNSEKKTLVFNEDDIVRLGKQKMYEIAECYFQVAYETSMDMYDKESKYQELKEQRLKEKFVAPSNEKK